MVENTNKNSNKKGLLGGVKAMWKVFKEMPILGKLGYGGIGVGIASGLAAAAMTVTNAPAAPTLIVGATSTASFLSSLVLRLLHTGNRKVEQTKIEEKNEIIREQNGKFLAKMNQRLSNVERQLMNRSDGQSKPILEDTGKPLLGQQPMVEKIQSQSPSNTTVVRST